jgi:hypothetical protein
LTESRHLLYGFLIGSRDQAMGLEMDQELAYFVANTLMAIVGVLILTLLWVASRIPQRTKAVHSEAPVRQTAVLLDASTTRRWMRFSADESEDQ